MTGPAADGDHPRRTADLMGHEAAERLLAETWAGGRLHHAWLFAGEPGTGRATLAFRMARFVLRHGVPEAGPVPVPPDLSVPPDDPVLRRVASGGHADLMVIEPPFRNDKGTVTADLNVDTARRIAPFLRRTAGEGGWRVVVVDEAQAMNRNSANAILKILEEPPPRALLLMVVQNPGALLPTIRSRCRTLSLRPLPETAVLTLLERRRPDLSPAERQAVVQVADGSIGRALALLDGDGLALLERIVRLLETLPRLDHAGAHAFAEEISRKGEGSGGAMAAGLLVWWLERFVRSQARGVLPPEAVPGEEAAMRRLAAVAGLDRWLAACEKTALLVRRTYSANLDRRHAMLTAFFQLEEAVR